MNDAAENLINDILSFRDTQSKMKANFRIFINSIEQEACVVGLMNASSTAVRFTVLDDPHGPLLAIGKDETNYTLSFEEKHADKMKIIMKYEELIRSALNAMN